MMPPEDRAAEETPDRGKNRDGHGRFTRSLEGAERDAEAARLRSRGLSLAQIAEQLDYAGPSGAYKAIQRALASCPVEAVEELRRLQLEQLDRVARRAWAVLETEHPLIAANGRVVEHDGTVLLDWRPTLRAIDVLLKAMDREAKLLGLDAPTQHRVLTLGQLDAWIEDLVAQLGEDGPDGF